MVEEVWEEEVILARLLEVEQKRFSEQTEEFGFEKVGEAEKYIFQEKLLEVKIMGKPMSAIEPEVIIEREKE
jgi:hypothetical protein